MVYDVEVCNVMEEEMTDVAEELAIHRCSGPTLEIPLPGTIVW